MSSLIQSVKGTRDFYPEELAARRWLYKAIRSVSESFGYQEYEGPYLESIELYAAKSGDELVKEQSFVFPDRGGNLIALRPELTPTLARMVAQKQRQLVYPVRWWSFGPFWRYERPQKGRAREFFQWNIDLFGIESPEADAEIVAIAAGLFKKVGLTPDQVKILVNSRRLVSAELSALGIASEKQAEISRWIDRRAKMNTYAWEAYASELGLEAKQIIQIKEFLQNYDTWKKSDDLSRFFAGIEAFGCRDYVDFDPNIVRGLDYYTGIVFEAIETDGEIRRSILGGGRYDNLLADVGGQPLPGVGFAMGDMVFSLVLEKHKLLPNFGNRPPAPILVTVFDESLLHASISLAAELRSHGFDILNYPESEKLSKQLKFADRMGIKIAIFLGPDELAKNLITIKVLSTGQQYSLTREHAAEALHKQLAGLPPS
ncbi:MAG: histidine--tRNA ligase [Anaerolineales bacterium]|nr:MAG: histidine--tRNA ligase [Anaerolineales bacterium]